jgi:hypothetical protein
MIKLKPCPFCGGEATFVVNTNISSNYCIGFNYYIKCSSCDCTPIKKDAEMHIFLDRDGEVKLTDESIVTRKSIIDAWNTRVKERGEDE